ncbi:ThiF family adenylyltransferase [Gimesia chilikensis]|uniref:Sulfur carrier protein ThiS adenylyltransferase n=1 Tax=Gimesia chilikensis TaxID=2605989 RepID=A0A517PVU6_9PLAN|nr:ThiF family adenylyltransferase [Gimesia chilikensis]QDT23498.1 Sulfur carrier protein ThiS adenylyltransferase [Gimesia chilikensis]
MTNTTVNRFQRQSDLVPPERLSQVSATVIGVGAIGRQVALQLTAIGVPRLQLIDFDQVELTNITTQGYQVADLGKYKTTATREAAESLAPEISITELQDRFRPRHNTGSVIFCCVDSISAREAIWRAISAKCEFFVDGRMLGELIRVLAISPPEMRDDYESTLFDQSEAHTGACTAQSTIYTANIAAGLMLHQFSRFLRCLPVDRDLSLNLLASELVLAPE